MNASQISPFTQAFQIATGFAQSQAVMAFAKMGIPDALKEDWKQVDDLALECSVHAAVLFRLLRFLDKLGVVDLREQSVRLSSVGQLLRSDVPGNLARGLELMSYEPWQECWNNLFYTLQTGNPAFRHVLGQEPWAYFRDNPQYGKPFNDWMTTLSQMSADALLRSYDFSNAGLICDVGGGHGFLLQSILAAYPSLQGILFDRPYVIADAALGETAERCTVTGGNFFERVPRADTMILKSILHDWSDESATLILKNCAENLRPGGKILAMDMLLSDETGLMSYFYDLHMLLMLGGRERTREEFERLFAEAGLRVERIIATGSPQVIIEARRK